ncbi:MULTISPECIES: hypothetical protein [unclassified Micromonospora]|uniref:hypothetical protein n=1 Tax=unclassified Micromonospora TaxID=2617518 RepID=UPI00331D8DBF
MDQETVERLLGGPVVDPQDAPQPVASLLTAVRAAPRAAELAGEDAAVRAYRLARAGTPVGGSERSRGRALAGFGVRAALAGVALAVTGGVAFAAAGGTLPGPLRGPAPTTAAPAPPAPPPVVSPTPGSGRPSAPPTTAEGRPDPSASLARLCRAYRTDGDGPDRTLDKPAFDDLVRAAGGRGKVAAYCDRLLPGESARPGSPGTPADRPGGTPTLQQSGRPTTSPSVPAGRPSAPGSLQDPPGDAQVSPGDVQVSPGDGRPTPGSGDGR